MAAQLPLIDSLFAAVPLPTALLDAARRVLRANEMWRSTFGAAGTLLRTLLNGQLSVLDDVLASAPGASHSGYRLNLQIPGSETRAVAFNVEPLGDGYFVVALFMPESLPMQDDSRSLLEAALDSTVDGMIILDNEGAVLASNDRFKRMWRLPDDWRSKNSGAEQIIMLGTWVRDQEMFVRRAEAVLFHPESEGYDVIETTDGRYFEVFHMPYRIGGQIAGRVWSFHDLSDRVRAEHELRESEWRFRQLAENIQVAFWVFDVRIRQLVYVSPTYERLMGRSSNALRNDAYSWISNVHPEDRELVLAAVARSEAGEYQETEYRLLLGDDGVRWMRSRSFPVRDEQGAVALIAGIAEDVTARNEAERQALDLALEREKVHILESFIADVSHDLKTPITVLKSSVYLVERFAERVLAVIKQNTATGMLNASSLIEVETAGISIRSHAQTLDANVTRLQRLVENLLEMFRLDRRVDFEFRMHELNEVIASVVDMQQPVAENKSIELTFCPTEDRLDVHCDAGELRRVVQNLIANALAYTPEGGSVTVSTSCDADHVAIEVKDTGIGISEAERSRIFERFYRIDKSRPVHTGGMGLGLSIARKIVDAHQGQISIDSTPGQGSTFRVELPRRPAAVQ